MQKRIYLSVFILLLAIMPVKSQTSVQGQIDSIMTIYPNCMDYPMDVLMTLDSLFQVLDSQQASDDGNHDHDGHDHDDHDHGHDDVTDLQKISDPKLIAYFNTNYPDLLNSEFQVDPLKVSEITLLNLDNLGLENINGLSQFTNLQSLSVNVNGLTELSDLPESLEYLYARNNQINFLGDFPSSLKKIDLRSNSLTYVNPFPEGVKDLKLCFNNIATISDLPDSLEIFYCAYNNLNALPDFPKNLTTALVYNNQISQIGALSLVINQLRIQNNLLTELPDLPETLTNLNISNNPLTCVGDYPSVLSEVLSSYPSCETLSVDSQETFNPFAFDMGAGWNMFGFACPDSTDLLEAFSDLVDFIVIVKNNEGAAYLPEYGFNGVGYLIPGHGYQVKLEEAVNNFHLCDYVFSSDTHLEDLNLSLQDSILHLNKLVGCNDLLATNYNENVLYDDGTCEYECTDTWDDLIDYSCIGSADPEVCSPYVVYRKSTEANHIGNPGGICYDVHPPSSGSHRPMWGKWGTYDYMPPQRYLHNLEHGGIALLYNPCVDSSVIDALEAFACARASDDGGTFRYILTPYHDLPTNIAVLAWEWSYFNNCFDANGISEFVDEHYRKAPEDFYFNGTYDNLFLGRCPE